MSSKLRLSGKGTRGTTALSEKEQIDLAIALSLQQQGKESQQAAEPLLAAGGPSGSDHGIEEPNAGLAAANAPEMQHGDEPRKRRAAALKRTYVVEESDSEGSPTSSAGRQGADDYKPESSASGSDSDDDSDFAGDDDSEDEGPRKKRKAETKGKKAPAKASAGNKKAGAASKSTGAAAAARGAQLAGAARAPEAAGARWRKGDAGTAAAAPGPAASVPAARPPVIKPTATVRPAPGAAELGAAARPAQQEDGGNGCEDAGPVPDTETGPQDPDCRGDRSEAAVCTSGQSPQLEDEVGTTVTAAAAKPMASKAMQPKAAAPKVTEPKAKAVAAPKPAAAKAPPLAKPAAAKGPAQVTPAVPKQPPKPLVVTNRATPGAAAASAPFKPPIGSAGGTSGMKASTPLLSGAMPYRVPGLRRPGGSSVTKKSS